ncbi:pectate lyase PelN [Uliginosibacterium sp. H3]|uniref:Pectate lyase PelN n=1 Tax=Uliginosibacterium silvisoli TaxID=3114758 RepID=A0ABU6K4D3_9RHOO|nr:pectate lyase PelN [Uliginosibacterium sp. H3]
MNTQFRLPGLALACAMLGCPLAATASTYYVSPSGSDTAAGTLAAPWKSVTRAQTTAVAGDTVYIRGGTYSIKAGVNTCASQTDTVNAILLDKSGSTSKPITYAAYSGETPVFDFSGMKDDCRIKGFNITASWITLKGLEVKGVPQINNLNHESWGVWINGSNNVIERLNVHHIMGAGVFIQNGGYNLVLNTDSHDNYDPKTSNGAGQSADGFGAHIKASNPGNVFRGCRAWNNSDDGFDLINAYSSVTIENSWAWHHGYLPGTDTPVAAGNGNGFKIGGYGGVYVSGGVKHTLRQSVAFNNKSAGVYTNHHTVANDYFNNTSFNNNVNFNMLGIDSGGNDVGLGTLRNNIAYKGTALSNSSGINTRYNTWDSATGVTVSDSDFQSVSTSGWDAARQSDGSLPVVKMLHLASGSDLIDKGGDVNLPYNGALPDLGAFETGAAASSSSSSKASSSSVASSVASSSSSSKASSSAASSASSSSGSGPVLTGTGDYPDGFSKCADEGATCSVSKGTGWVAYGRKGKWVTKNVGVGKSIACTAAAFGSDPGGNPNKCSIQN